MPPAKPADAPRAPRAAPQPANLAKESAMDFTELAAQRYSVRKYAERPVEAEKIQAVLEAGRLAPTAKNLQPQRIHVLQSPEALAKVREVVQCAFNAPVVLVCCGDVTRGWVNPFSHFNHTETDVAIVTCHMMLKATELGLGTLWVGLFDPQKITDTFELPEQEIPFALLLLGYAAEDATPAPAHSARKPLSETVSWL